VSPVQRAQVGIPTCTSKVDLIRSVVSFEGVAAAAEIHAHSYCGNKGDVDVLVVVSVVLAVESELAADAPASAR
jgi:hypothetical protein